MRSSTRCRPRNCVLFMSEVRCTQLEQVYEMLVTYYAKFPLSTVLTIFLYIYCSKTMGSQNNKEIIYSYSSFGSIFIVTVVWLLQLTFTLSKINSCSFLFITNRFFVALMPSFVSTSWTS
jgi:hypothetical protein